MPFLFQILSTLALVITFTPKHTRFLFFPQGAFTFVWPQQHLIKWYFQNFMLGLLWCFGKIFLRAWWWSCFDGRFINIYMVSVELALRFCCQRASAGSNESCRTSLFTGTIAALVKLLTKILGLVYDHISIIFGIILLAAVSPTFFALQHV